MFQRLLLILGLLVLPLHMAHAQVKPKPKPQPKEEEKDRMTVAIKKGQTFLKSLYPPQQRNGPPANPMQEVMAMVGIHGNGQASVTGLALLESGVPNNDPSIVYIANGLRNNALSVSNTYEVSLVIMFLDRLGEPNDEALIQFMSLRLLSGQCADGTWAYDCGGLYLDPVEMRQLRAKIVRESKMATAPKGGKNPKNSKTDPKKLEPEPKDDPKSEEPTSGLHPSLQKFAKIIYEGGTVPPATDAPGPRGPFPGGFPRGVVGRSESGDHSNTQFATVAMWCGRRHFIETAKAFKLLEKHYRDSQAEDGGWSYAGAAGGSTPAMTCAGLIGVAMGFGSKNARLVTQDGVGKEGEKPLVADPGNDKVMENGLKCLGNYLAAAAAIQNRDQRGIPDARGRFLQTDLSTNLYFMWSLERVAMIYGLQTIGKIDWFVWGSECLLDSQQANGVWSLNNYPGSNAELDTAFALLFLNRANLAQDLSASLKGKVRDPGTSRLIGGGDLAKLLEPGSRTGTGTTTRKPEPKRPADPEPGTAPANPKNVPMPPAVPNTNEFETKVRALVRAVVDGDPSDQARLIEDYREAKGGEHTEALAQIATRLSDDPQAKARAALAGRLTRMKATTLAEYMKDRDREIRRAAAVATGAKGEKTLAPDLIRLLGDNDVGVIQAARGGLKQISGEDFGPAINATAGEKSRALLAWRKWLDGMKK